jgi:sugar phosphate isomerase/epimerase
MIPLSVCTIAWQRKDRYASPPPIEVPLAELLPRLPGLGFTGVEIWEPHLAAMPAADLSGIRHRLADLGLAVPMVSGYYDFTGDAERCAASERHAEAVLARTAAVGGRAIRIFTGKQRSSTCTPEGRVRAVAALRRLADRAGDLGIRLAAEVHDWNLTDTIEACEDLVREVGRPSFGLIFHPSMFSPDPVPALHRLWPRIFHIHATNPPGGIADGPIDWRRLVAVLAARGYAGWLSVEWFAADPDAATAREAAALAAACAALAPATGRA